MCAEKKATHSFRIGIDVGGTFTHAVALDSRTLAIIGSVKVPTTHKAKEGVAKGIIEALHQLLDAAKIKPADVSFIAHSTTQATNALLEGDLAPVGILGMASGKNGWLAAKATNLSSIDLGGGRSLAAFHEFFDPQKGFDCLPELLRRLKDKGAKAIAISQAFSVDDAKDELRAAAMASEVLGLPITSGSQVSKLYGLRARTRTAAINAAMLPKMIETADMTERSVRQSGINAAIMIMRSDGGVMDIDAMRKRPILTLLSGPAAGVAAATMYLNISDGIFVEVGGTSTDISAIKNGKAVVKEAEIGGQRIYMRTLDVRTLGVAGGSMVRTRGNEIVDLGPRSAHIAGLGYASFNPPLAQPACVAIKPTGNDPGDYLALKEQGAPEATITVTPTCAANLLQLVPENDCARGNIDSIKSAFSALSQKMQGQPEALAERMLQLAAGKCRPVIQSLSKEYKLDPRSLCLVGGGGGAAAIVPYLAKQVGAQHSLAQHADVISAIGVALALLRETVERNIIQPKPDDILKIRAEAFDAVAKMGADPSTIQIHVEVDPRANVVRATAFGATGSADSATAGKLDEAQRLSAAAHSMQVEPEAVSLVASIPHFQVFSSPFTERRLLGIITHKTQRLRALDQRGVVRLQSRDGVARATSAGTADSVILELAEEHAHYGDAGKVIPDILLLAGPRIIDLSGVADAQQIVALAKTELASVPPETPTVVIANLP